ncbi:AAA family ATPase [Pseudogulbenkiania ferrooxidans]|nr:ATP-binding protein [Pseudogulbenkiania ferrooxidans]
MTVIIGQNNSGKSRLIRKIFQSPSAETIIENIAASNEIKEIIEPVISEIRQYKPHTAGSVAPVENFLKETFTTTDEHKKRLDEYIDFHNKARQGNISYGEIRQQRANEVLSQGDREQFNVAHLVQHFEKPKSFYIPILRGMRPLTADGEIHLDVNSRRTVKDYFPEISDKNSIYTGHSLYELLKSHLLGKPEQRELIRKYEKRIGEVFFENLETTLIPEHNSDTVAVKIGHEEQFPIYNLGDGLQQVIIISSAAFLTETPSLFFIEEPEIGLHPGLLKRLIKFLIDETNHQFIVTTHSNHILELAEIDPNIIIHKCKKRAGADGTFVEIEKCGKDNDFLIEMGVHPSSVFLSNCTIWVEGITDRLYIKKFIEKYIQEQETKNDAPPAYIEDYHYSFVEYQGSTLTHWNFSGDHEKQSEQMKAAFTTASAFVIADGDIIGKGTRADDLSSQLGESVHILKCKETENLLPKKILVKTVRKLHESKKSPLKESIQIEDIENLDETLLQNSTLGIGHHIDVALGLQGKGQENERYFSDASGTISAKVNFCRSVIEVMDEVEWELSDEARTLCAKIFDHIAVNNPDYRDR